MEKGWSSSFVSSRWESVFNTVSLSTLKKEEEGKTTRRPPPWDTCFFFSFLPSFPCRLFFFFQKEEERVTKAHGGAYNGRNPRPRLYRRRGACHSPFFRSIINERDVLPYAIEFERIAGKDLSTGVIFSPFVSHKGHVEVLTIFFPFRLYSAWWCMKMSDPSIHPLIVHVRSPPTGSFTPPSSRAV